MQAQYAPSPYVALWSRVEGFRKEQLTDALVDGSLVKAGSFRTTLHVMSARRVPVLASSYIESQRAASGRRRLRCGSVPDEPVESAELLELGHRVLGTEDRWMSPSPLARCRSCAPHRSGRGRTRSRRRPCSGGSRCLIRGRARRGSCGSISPAYGPASRVDMKQFTGFRFGQIDAALDGMRDVRDETVSSTCRARRAQRRTCRPRCGSYRRSTRSSSRTATARRIVPPEYVETVFNKRNATTKNTFTVDGFVAGAWRIEKSRLVVEPFAPLPLRVRREVDAEGERLLAWYVA